MKALVVAISLVASSVSAQTVPVLEYHEIVSAQSSVEPSDTVITITEFNAQMAWLRKNGYTTMTAADLVRYMRDPNSVAHGAKPIVITFDDGWVSQQNAIPALKRNGFKATFNIIAQYPSNSASYMNWDQIQKLAKSGFDIESHSFTHQANQLVPSDFKKEIEQSKQEIESHTGKPVSVIAWPNGSFTSDMIVAAISSNYEGALTIDENWCWRAGHPIDGECVNATGNAPHQNPYLVKRVFMDGRCTLDEFAQRVTTGHSSPCVGKSRYPDNSAIMTPEARLSSLRDFVDPTNTGQ